MDRYKYIKFIGRGNYGSAHLVADIDTGEKLVVKQIPINEMNESERKQAHQEVRHDRSRTARPRLTRRC